MHELENVDLEMFREGKRIFAILVDKETGEEVKYWLYTWDGRCTLGG